MSAHVTFGLAELPGRVGSVEGHHELSVRLPIPTHLSEADLATFKRDSELFTQMLAAHPKEFTSILNAIGTGKMSEAVKIAQEIGLSESHYQKQGGGLISLLILAIVVAGVLYAGDAF